MKKKRDMIDRIGSVVFPLFNFTCGVLVGLVWFYDTPKDDTTLKAKQAWLDCVDDSWVTEMAFDGDLKPVGKWCSDFVGIEIDLPVPAEKPTNPIPAWKVDPCVHCPGTPKSCYEDCKLYYDMEHEWRGFNRCVLHSCFGEYDEGVALRIREGY